MEKLYVNTDGILPSEMTGSSKNLQQLLKNVKSVLLDDMPAAVSPVRLYEETHSHHHAGNPRISRLNLMMKALVYRGSR